MIRNSVDHGIEMPEVRSEKGKDPTGKITLNAYHKEGHIIIEISDDGQGLDKKKILQKAVERGVVEEEANLSDQEIYQLIFAPGFSTNEEVTETSGRGVGMDVVKRTVEKDLEGQVYIDTEQGGGTKFTISLPLTLAITEALMVKIGKETFALPLSNVNETLKIEKDNIKQVKGQDVIIRHDKTIPLIDSRVSLNMDISKTKNKIKKKEIEIVVIDTGDREIGFIIDQLLSQQEIVIKSISEYLNVEEISGATIIGDGDIALILDVRNIA
jgi:two-component system chemotaxis sensor kinase CheA